MDQTSTRQRPSTTLPCTYDTPAPYTPAIQGSTGNAPSDLHQLLITTVELQVITSALRIAHRRSFMGQEVGDPHPAELARTREIVEALYRAIVGR